MKNKEARKLKGIKDPHLKAVKPGETPETNVVQGPGAEGKKGKKKGRRIRIIVLASVIILVAASAGIFVYYRTHQESGWTGFGGGGRNSSAVTFTVTEDMVAASGVISVGTETEDLDVDLTTTLEVEEVYVSSGDEIQEGTAILKLNEEDVAEAREELESALKEAELAYRAGAIEYQQNLITAKYDYDSALLEGEQASAVYEATMDSLTSDVEKAQEALDEAEEAIAEYEAYVNDSSYSSYFGVDTCQATYDEHYNLLVSKMEEWGVSWSEVTGRSSDNLADEHSQYVYVLQQLYSVLESDAKLLETAKEEYEDAVDSAALNLQTLNLSLASLKADLAEAKENYETRSAEAKLTYETSLSNAERAQSDYDTDLEKIESDYAELLDAYEDAQENLAAFEELIGDGTFYASASGSVLRVMTRTGQSLMGGSSILSYSDTSEMTVTVSVDQTDIAKLNVGDGAYLVSASDGGAYEGVITAIDPVTSSTSRTNITYNVTVEVTGDSEGLTSNETVTVVFGMDEETMQNLMNQSTGETGETGGENGQMPSGEDGQMPSGEDGQMPSGEEGEMPSFGEGQMPSSEDGERPSFSDGEMPQRGEGNGMKNRSGESDE